MSEYIKRDDAVKALHDLWREFYIRDEDVDSDSDTECFCGGILTASHTIAKLPPADVIEHKRGKWVATNEVAWGAPLYKCSLCDVRISDVPISEEKPLFPFCPWCSADMRGKDDGE